MKNKDLWIETKFVKTNRGYEPSNQPKYVMPGSRFIAFVQARIYSRIIKEHTCGLLLDLGCGHVPLYNMYKDRVIDNICVDWGNTSHKNPYFDYEIDLNGEIPLESNSFDTILITDVLEHIVKPDLLISEMARLLKPKGKIILTVPFFYWLHEQPYDYFRYTEFALKIFCQQNNLTILSLEPYGGVPEIILDMIAKHIYLLKSFSGLAYKIHLAFSKMFIQSDWVKKLSQRESKTFPLGYYLIAQK